MTKKGERTKRGNRRGSVRRLPSGMWQPRLSIDGPDGEPRRVPLGTFKTKTEAEQALSAAITDAGRGQFAVSEKTTLGEYLTAWHEQRQGGLAAKYAYAQKSLIENHIVPVLGRRRLASITPRDLEALYAGLTSKRKLYGDRRGEVDGGPVSDSVKRQVHNLIHLALAEAMRHGDLLRNPADVARPRYTRAAAKEEKPKAWTPEQAKAFYDVARSDRLGSVFCFMLSTGLRVGETLGLRWEHVDLHTGRVDVKDVLVSLSGTKHRTTPKTPRSRRTITVSGDALAILKEWKERPALDWEAQAQGKPYVASDAVFTNTLGGPILPDTIYPKLRALCAAAQVPYLGAHACRHTFISLMGAQGQPVEVVSAQVGHARPSFTLDRYRTVFAKEREALTLDFATLIQDSERKL